MIYNIKWKMESVDFGHCEKNAMTTQRAVTSFSPQVLRTSQRSPLGHPLGRFCGGLGRGGTSFRDTVFMTRKPVIRKGFAGVSDSDFVRKKKPIFQGSSGGETRLTPEQRHKQFVEKLNTWLRANCGQLIDALYEHDPKGAGLVPKETFKEALLVVKAPITPSLHLGLVPKETFKEALLVVKAPITPSLHLGLVPKETFKEALLVVKAPITPEELHVVLKHVTNCRDKVDYLAFAKGVKIPFPGLEELPTEDIKLNVRDISNAPCTKCKLKFPPTEKKEIRPRYIQLNLELLQFTDRELPCNFTLTISDSMSVFGVKQIIQDKFGHSLVDLNIYPEKAVNETLPNACTLSELGFRGHTVDDPVEVTLYYDVHLHTDLAQQFYACPLLLTDHYFAKHEPKQPVNVTRETALI
eukprot:sb/3479488/